MNEQAKIKILDANLETVEESISKLQNEGTDLKAEIDLNAQKESMLKQREEEIKQDTAKIKEKWEKGTVECERLKQTLREACNKYSRLQEEHDKSRRTGR